MDNPSNPNVTVTADEGPVSGPSPAGTSKTVRFQCGLLRETETFPEEDLEDVSLYAIMEFVVEMLNAKVLYASSSVQLHSHACLRVWRGKDRSYCLPQQCRLTLLPALSLSIQPYAVLCTWLQRECTVWLPHGHRSMRIRC